MKIASNKNTKGTRAGREIISALRELRDTLAAGIPLEDKYTVRHVDAPEPGKYNARAVKAVRRRLGLSQRVFAKLVGVSVILEQSWEQGVRFPNATARRLLDEMNRSPDYWTSILRPAEKSHHPRERVVRS